ncbi:MAG: glycerol-3-phosphate 1-O-acyltransferase PlsY [Sphingomonas sp.]|nr:glycerol-3-phosphate 1-O-acyltransferase PlsY [Sphingomonas sp.]
MSWEPILSWLVGYVLGSIPFGLLLTRLAGKGDIRELGSGNIGATNVLRSGSKALAAATLLLDALKATAAILLARELFGRDSQSFAAAGALIGHLYPLWLRFKGGKGVATLLGILIVLLPIAAAVYAFIWVGLLLTARISSVAGMAAAVTAPVTAAVLGADDLLPMLIGFALLVVWKHRANMARLKTGTEPRIGKSPP